MELVTLREYAKTHKISYEAVRKQVVRYSEELKDHITIKDRTQYLDAWAVDFLTERRKSSPIVLTTINQDEELQELREQIKALQVQVFSKQEQIIKLQEEAKAMLETKVRYEMLLTDNQEKKERLEEAKTEVMQLQKEVEQVKAERDAAQAEAGSFQRSIFGFYRKR